MKNQFTSLGHLKGKVKYLELDLIEIEVNSKNEVILKRMLEKNEFYFDEDTNIVELYSSGFQDTHTKYSYNEKGERIEALRVDLNSKNIYKFDEIGNEIECKGYDKDGKLVKSSVYTYDINRKRITENGVPISFSTDFDEKYNEEGNIIESSSWLIKETFNYILHDSNGNWVKMIRSWDNIPKYLSQRIIEYYD